MLDLAINGGVVVDGTGAPRRRANVGVRDGRVVAIGNFDEAAEQTIDATGLVVAPGFVDIHTHYDAQLWWDPTLAPSSLHGVTTVVAGNCGFTLAPIGPEHTDYITRMLALVEGMPLETLFATIPYNWGTFGEFLDRVEGRVAVNMGFMVGHSTVRRFVMGGDAVGTAASPTQIEEMCDVLGRSLDAGGLGFSSSQGVFHHDGDGNPVPSRAASEAELVALARVTGTREGTTLEFIPTKEGSPLRVTAEAFELMCQMSSAADRPINWNVLQVDAKSPDFAMELVRVGESAGGRGARIVPLTSCDVLYTYISFKSGFVLASIPGWAHTMTLPAAEKLHALQDPDVRTELVTTGEQSRWDWAQMTVVKRSAAQKGRYEGMTVGDVARDLNCRPIEAVFDLVVADELETLFLPSPAPGMGDEESAWKLRGELWRDPRVVVGASDAGAHLDVTTTFTFGTSVLRAAREHQLMSLEDAVQLVTDRPARLYGLRERGRIQEGWHADVVIFEEDSIAPGPIYWRDDLPGGAGRLFSDPHGVRHVLVNGREIVRDNEPTGATPGAVLRSGSDTETVTAR